MVSFAKSNCTNTNATYHQCNDCRKYRQASHHFLFMLFRIVWDMLCILNELRIYITNPFGKLFLFHTSIPSLSKYFLNFKRISYKIDFTLL